MWQLYSLLKNGLEGTEQEYLIDTVSSMLDKLSQHEFVSSMQLMYRDTDLTKLNPVQMVTMFISGLKKNELLYFSDFIKGLTNGSTHRG